MELKYMVTDAHYQELIAVRRRERMMRPLNIIFTVSLVSLPICIYLYCFTQHILVGWQILVFAIGALAISGLNLLVRVRFWRASGTELEIMKKGGDIDPNFWREHKMKITTDGVKVICGDYSAQHDWINFGGIEVHGSILLLLFSREPIDIIPLSALDGVGGFENFEARLTSLAREAIHIDLAKVQADVPSEPLLTLSYDYTLECYLRDQRDAKRQQYFTRTAWNRTTFAKLFLSLVLVYAIFTTASMLLPIAYLVILFFLNYEHISAFTPLGDRTMKKQLRPLLILHPARSAKLFLTETEIKVVGDLHCIDLPLSEVLAVRHTHNSIALYLLSRTVLTVPAPPATDAADFAYFCTFVAEKIAHRKK